MNCALSESVAQLTKSIHQDLGADVRAFQEEMVTILVGARAAERDAARDPHRSICQRLTSLDDRFQACQGALKHEADKWKQQAEASEASLQHAEADAKAAMAHLDQFRRENMDMSDKCQGLA